MLASEDSGFVRWQMHQVNADGCFVGEAGEQQLGRNSEAVFAADGAESNSSAVFRGALWKSRLTLWFWGRFLWANHVSSHHQCGPHSSSPSWFPLLFTPPLLTVFVRQYWKFSIISEFFIPFYFHPLKDAALSHFWN